MNAELGNVHGLCDGVEETPDSQRNFAELLAEKADIHPTHVGLIERSLRNPSLNVAQAIAMLWICR